MVGEKLMNLQRYGMSWNLKNWPFDIITFFSLHLSQNHHQYMNEFLNESLGSIEQSNFKQNFKWILKVIGALN
jgi:hypothetical protein